MIDKEDLILSNVIHDEEYARRVLPHLDKDYFFDATQRIIFETILHHFNEYNSLPSWQAIIVELDNKDVKISDKQHEHCVEYVKTRLSPLPKDTSDRQWLVDVTEKFCQEKAIYNAIMKSIRIFENKEKDLERGSIPTVLQDALSVKFDKHIGHDFLEDYQHRYDFYHLKEHKIPFDLEMFNLITRGGISRKTLTVFLGGTNVGKTLFMCHCAAANMTMGYNVLYLTMEMSEEKIAERIEANVLDCPIEQLCMLPHEGYIAKIKRMKQRVKGKLIIKEFPTASVNVNHFRFVLNELKNKKQFVPDIIYIDYLNICASARLKTGSNINTYQYVKAIAEELRGMAVEYNVPIVTATQTTRSGFDSSDPELTDTSESFGVPATADLQFALVQTEQYEELGQYMVKQLKNRYADKGQNKRFFIGVDKNKMRLYDIDQADSDLVRDNVNVDKPIFDHTQLGSRVKEEFGGKKRGLKFD